MYCLLKSASALYSLYEKISFYASCIRRNYIIPIAHYGERDMFLLTNGQWVDTNAIIDPTMITWMYDATKRHILHTKIEGGGLMRFPISSVVTQTDFNLSDFFSGLRITRTTQPFTCNNLISLLVHQTGVLPALPLICITRTGEDVLLEMSDSPVPGSV